jgi:hypothetical protein
MLAMVSSPFRFRYVVADHYAIRELRNRVRRKTYDLREVGV